MPTIKNITQAKLVEEIKKQSSKWIKSNGDQYKDFYWQAGYGIFSVNPSQLDVVTKYIANQKEHHSKKSFQDELLSFFEKFLAAMVAIQFPIAKITRPNNILPA